jgi:hypothetical protein
MTVRAQLSRLLRQTDGVTLPLVAAAITALIGFTGLGVETGFWYAIKRQNQSAADVAALSGGFELLAGQTYPDICGFAKRDATRNGFNFQSFTCPTTTPACTSPSSGQMCANNPPQLGANAGNNNAVEVILAQQQNALFALLSLANVTIDTRAVAVVSILDQSCMLALDPTASDAILIQGNPTLTMPNCSIVSDSNSASAVHFQGSASVTADTVRSHGGITQTGSAATITLSQPAQSNAPVVADPYASTLTHSFLTTGPPALATSPACNFSTVGGVTTVFGSVAGTGNCVLSNGTLQIKGATYNLSPGTYWINNGDLQLGPGGGTSLLECTSCNGGSLGVTIIFTTTGPPNKIGTVTMQSSSAQIGNLNAPNSGTFKGLLFVQDTVAGASYTTSGTLQGGPSVALNGTGLVYFPHTTLAFQGTPQLGTNGCLIVVADQVQLVGDSTLSAAGCSSAGLNTTPTVKTVALAE